jgi:hypothetical protein
MQLIKFTNEHIKNIKSIILIICMVGEARQAGAAGLGLGLGYIIMRLIFSSILAPSLCKRRGWG